MQITSEAISFGYAIFKGPLELGIKLAVLVTNHHAGLYRNGLGLCEPHQRDMWNIHWCNSSMKVEEAAAVIEYVKTLPLYIGPK